MIFAWLSSPIIARILCGDLHFLVTLPFFSVRLCSTCLAKPPALYLLLPSFFFCLPYLTDLSELPSSYCVCALSSQACALPWHDAGPFNFLIQALFGRLSGFRVSPIAPAPEFLSFAAKRSLFFPKRSKRPFSPIRPLVAISLLLLLCIFEFFFPGGSRGVLMGFFLPSESYSFSPFSPPLASRGLPSLYLFCGL